MKRIRMIDYKLELLSVKYFPVIMFLIMWIHTGLLILGINGPYADIIAGSAIIPSILIFSMCLTFNIYNYGKML